MKKITYVKTTAEFLEQVKKLPKKSFIIYDEAGTLNWNDSETRSLLRRVFRNLHKRQKEIQEKMKSIPLDLQF
jgi:hypothetical protein